MRFWSKYFLFCISKAPKYNEDCIIGLPYVKHVHQYFTLRNRISKVFMMSNFFFYNWLHSLTFNYSNLVQLKKPLYESFPLSTFTINYKFFIFFLTLCFLVQSGSYYDKKCNVLYNLLSYLINWCELQLLFSNGGELIFINEIKSGSFSDITILLFKVFMRLTSIVTEFLSQMLKDLKDVQNIGD